MTFLKKCVDSYFALYLLLFILYRKSPLISLTIKINIVKFIMPNYIQPELFLIISTGRTAQYVVNSTETVKLNDLAQN